MTRLPMTPDYADAAERYRPDRIRVLFVAESPPAFTDPAKQSYFYFENNPGSDILFATLVEAVYGARYRKSDGNKGELLRRLQGDGYWMMDVSEEPINRIQGKKPTKRELHRMVEEAVPGLLDRLGDLRDRGILSDSTGLILIKKAVFEIARRPLVDAGYRVLGDEKIDFPKYYGDRDTIRGIREALGRLPERC